MQTLSFSCPLCGRRMGVGIELLGRPVRCPHCRQVVMAPPASTRGGPQGSEPGPSAESKNPEPIPPLPRSSLDPPVRVDSPESIFGHDDESVFGRSQGPPSSSMSSSPPGANDSTERMIHKPDYMSIVETPPPGGRTDNFKPPSVPPVPVQEFPPRSVPTEELRASPRIEEPANPYTGVAGLPQPGTRVPSLPPVKAPLFPVEAATAEVSESALLRWALIGVIIYAVIVTVLAVWGWLRVGDRGHPLLFIPDVFGEYRKASRDRVTDLRKYPAFDQPVPPELRVKLGQTLTLGELQVEPIAIEARHIVRVTEFTSTFGETARQVSRNPCLVLKLKIRNLSHDVALYPLDPAFNRASVPGIPVPLTGLLLADGRQFMGSSIHWPFLTGYKRIYYEGQEADDELLFPQRERESVIVSADLPNLVDAVRSQTQPVTWNVHIRRGLTTLYWEDYSVGALFGVDFEPGQILFRDPKNAG